VCGILGYFERTDRGRPQEGSLERMLATLERRGPDDRELLSRDGLHLGHARLSIIDIAGGHQPMFNETGDVACILNGEIYNFQVLREELLTRGHRFASRSDTEVIVHGYEEFGAGIFARLRGMFAIVIADFRDRTLLVARDRIGEKPLYYVDTADFFGCASELKALRLLPQVSGAVHRGALATYLQFGYVVGRESILQGIRRLGPGEYLRIDARGSKLQSYWQGSLRAQPRFNRREVLDALPQLVLNATRSQMVADVPVGVFLSGGLDSSVVTAAAARTATGTLRTFSIGFEHGANELPFARSVARMYGTDHTEIVLTPDIESTVDRVVEYFDEPFADSSSVPTYAVSEAARRHVKVALSGDGGDELYCGYDSYLDWRFYSQSRPLRFLARRAGKVLGAVGAHRVFEALYPLPRSRGAGELWQRLRSGVDQAEVAELLGGDALAAPPVAESVLAIDQDPLAQALQFDLTRYLPDDLLKKVDMAAMANSLESRAPLLDLDLVEFMLGVPAIEKLRGGRTKSLMREAFAAWLPADVVDRPKQGFGAPVAAWLEGPLRRRVAALRDPQRPVWRLLDASVGMRLIDRAFATQRTDWRAPHVLWSLMMLDGWAERYGAASAA